MLPETLLAPTRIRATRSRRVARSCISLEGHRLATATAERARPGALQPDTVRALLVFSDDGELAVALRERVAPRQALIRDVRRHEAGEAIRACRPFPWMVVGEGDPPEPMDAVCAGPTLVMWRAPLARAFASHTVGFRRFAELCAEVERALSNSVGGMRLAIGEGVSMPDGACVRSAYLDTLVAAHPSGRRLPPSVSRSVAAQLRRHGVCVSLVRDAAGLAMLR
jgi:hypothetical protein